MDTKHTTNYMNTLIEVAEDCPSTAGEVPPYRGDKRSVANLQFEMLIDHPYQYSSDEVLFGVYAQRHQIADDAYAEAWMQYFSKGQPCFRASPLTKRYGWGIHSDHEGKIAMLGVDSLRYRELLDDATVKKVKAMRTSRK